MSRVFISEDDIRLQFAIWDNTLIRFTVSDIGLDSGSISVIVNKKPKGIKDDDDKVYILEGESYDSLKHKVNIIYSPSGGYNKLLGAAYGSDILICEDEKLLSTVLINKGKFREVIFFKDSENEIGGIPTIELDMSESIVQSYSGFINYLEETDDFMKNNGLFTLLFPTDIKVPDEDEQSIELILNKEETDELIENINEQELVKKCSIFTNSKFLDKLSNAIFLTLSLFGIFFVDNQFNIFDYNLFDQYISQSSSSNSEPSSQNSEPSSQNSESQSSHERIYQILLRMLISLNTFNLISSHDNLKDFLINVKEGYDIKTKSSENWYYY